MAGEGWDKDPAKYSPLSGLEVQQDGTVFDVPAWREGQTQDRNGQNHTRVYDPQAQKMLGDILEVLQKIETHLGIVTGEGNI